MSAKDDEIDIVRSGVVQNDRSYRQSPLLDLDDLDLVGETGLERRAHETSSSFLESVLELAYVGKAKLRLVVEAMQDDRMEYVKLGLILLGEIEGVRERLFGAPTEIGWE
jgi:hypothetical protein